jgi:dihydrofolate reductase
VNGRSLVVLGHILVRPAKMEEAMISIYVACSLDGFIAKADGNIDWLNEIPNETGSDYGFNEFMDRIECLIIGRNTFETVLGFGLPQ